MIRQKLHKLKSFFDLLIIFSPLALLLDNGVNKFFILFYMIYVPFLVIDHIRKQDKKNHVTVKKNVTKKRKAEAIAF